MTDSPKESWERIRERIAEGDAPTLVRELNALTPVETARAISRLTDDEREALFRFLSPQQAADVIRDLPDAQAADVIEDLPPSEAASIVESLPSGDRADVLDDVRDDAVEAILDEMSPRPAEEARAMLAYPDHSAGSLMVSEYLAYPVQTTVQQVEDDLRANKERYTAYDIQYIYVVSPDRRLEGVLRIRDLVVSPPTALLSSLMIARPVSIRAGDTLEQLRSAFQDHAYMGLPVVDDAGRLLGVLSKARVEEAAHQRAAHSFLALSGIVGGEEFRTMPLRRRVARRLWWLMVNIPLNVLAASVVAVYQETISAAVVLAVFLPIISDMSGNAGFQAAAVSIRELSLGLIRPGELLRVLLKELSVGLVNGVVLGGLLNLVAVLWNGNPWLGLVVGAALALNTLLSAVVGGLLPLVLRKLRFDPALASGPILTTITDMCGFFFVLSFASALLPRLT